MSYDLGPVKPWVRAAAEEVGRRFHIASVGGWGTRPNATDHDDGLALDFMTRNGAALAEYVRANARRLGVTYVIWSQHIWSVARSGEGWRLMEDRGSDTANHKDHVHVSFTTSAPAGGGAVVPAGGDWTTRHASRSAGGDTSRHAGATPVGLGIPGADELAETVRGLALLGGALFLGVALIGVGAARVARPALSKATDDALTVASFVPQTSAAATAAKTTKGATR